MKSLFTVILLISSTSFANQNILCYNEDRSENIQINTTTGKILFNNKYEVKGAVYSGVNSNTNYNGEILGEIELNGPSYYVTLIVRNFNGQLSIESQLYPSSGNTENLINHFNSCILR